MSKSSLSLLVRRDLLDLQARNFLVVWAAQRRLQVLLNIVILRFRGAKYIFMEQDFCFYYVFETNVSVNNKISSGAKMFCGALPQNFTSMTTGLGPPPKKE